MKDVVFRSMAEYRTFYGLKPKPIKGDKYYRAGVEIARRVIKELEI